MTHQKVPITAAIAALLVSVSLCGATTHPLIKHHFCDSAFLTVNDFLEHEGSMYVTTIPMRSRGIFLLRHSGGTRKVTGFPK